MFAGRFREKWRQENFSGSLSSERCADDVYFRFRFVAVTENILNSWTFLSFDRQILTVAAQSIPVNGKESQ